MIATCPACATRYVVDPAALGRQGRTVRCARCRNTWHLEPPEDVLAEAEDVQRSPRYIPGAEVSRAAPAQPEDAPEESGQADPRGEQTAQERAALRGARRNLPAVRQDGRRQMLIAWGALGGALLIFLGILIGLRGPISAGIPAMAAVYDAVGLGVEKPLARVEPDIAAADVLVFTGLGLRLESESGVPVLTVTGQISNSTTRRFPLPPIRATLLDADKREVYSWEFDPPADAIGAGQALGFASRLSNPPAQVREAVLTFVSGESGGE